MSHAGALARTLAVRDDGIAAARAGRPLLSNPHPGGELFHGVWRRGWLDGRGGHTPMHSLEEFQSRPHGVDFPALRARNMITARVQLVRGLTRIDRDDYRPQHAAATS